MHLSKPLTRVLLSILISFFVAGCTEERAIALKTAVEAFSDKAQAAIDALIDQNVRSTLGKVEPEEVMIKRTVQELIRTQQKAPSQLNQVIPNSFVWVNARQKAMQNIGANYDDLRRAYIEFAQAYKRLPEGSFVAAKDVACSASLGARLTNYMAQAGKTLASNPAPLIWENSQDMSALVGVTIDAVKSGNEKSLDDAVRAHVAFLKEQNQVTADVVTKLADAATAGAEVLDLIDKYNDISVADLLNGLRRILAVRENYFGLSSKEQQARLDDVINKLNSRASLANAIAMPINEKPVECK